MMTEDEFELYLDNAIEELKAKQETLTRDHRMGQHERWFFDTETDALRFYDGKDLKLEADVVYIGNYATGPSTWKWGWANDTLQATMKAQTEPLKELAAITGQDLFENAEAFEIGQGMEWELAAFAVQHLGLLGCYRAPSADRKIFTFLGIRTLTTAGH